MYSSQDTATIPFARFNLTPETFEEFRRVHSVMNCTEERKRSCNEMPFFDWEAKKLAQVFAHFKDDRAICGLIAAMMYCVKDDFRRTRKSASAEAPTRCNTFGMVV